ncbi:MAG TPA: polysaccharide biosynthesis tyrosine autokinase, partial [Allosphingosinicella sp.]
MGKNELEPKGSGAVWPLATRAPASAALHPLNDRDASGGGSSELGAINILLTIWAWRWLVLGGIMLGVAGGVLATLLTTPTYRAVTTLELNSPAFEVMQDEQSMKTSANDREFLETQYGLLQSRALAQRVVQELNLVSDANVAPAEGSREERQRALTNQIVTNIQVMPNVGSRLVDVAYVADDPTFAARVANGLAEGFINSGLERRYQSSSYARDFLQRQIGIVRQELENTERQLVAYAQQQGIINTATSSVPGQAGAASDANSPTGDSLIALNRELAQATARRIAAEQRFRQVQSAGATAEVSERTATLRNQLATAQAEYQDKLALFQPDYPQMVQLRQRIGSLEQAINNETSNVRAGRIGTLRSEFNAAAAEERALAGRVAGLQSAVLNLRGRTIQYNILQRDVDTNRALYDALLQRYKEIGVAGGVGASQASIVDRAEVPTVPYKPNIMLNVLLGFVLGLVTGVGLALALEFLNDTIKSPDDVREKLQLAFLGGIPASTGKAVAEIGFANTPISEAYFSAITSLQFTTESGAPKVLLVTSTRAAEGKSTSSFAIATSFARLGRRVLLIDADMRKPAFVTGNEKKDGLANLLTNRDPLSAHVISVENANLHLLPCGPLPPNPAELLSSARLEAILAEATSEYDMVIIDSPPILGLADTPLLSSMASATLMVIEAGKTRTRAASEALGRLRQSGANVVGALLTRYKHDAIGYGYKYEAYRYETVE